MSFELFQKKGGKFRISVINACNLTCFFCHNEGMTPTPDRLGLEDLAAIANAYTGLGGKQINITGGEPLARKDLPNLLDRIEKRNTRIVLNSNVVLADRLLKRPKFDSVDSILASLHTTDDEIFRKDLGGRSVKQVMNNIVALRNHGYDVQVNYSLGPYNQNEFGSVVDFCVRHAVPLKAIALVRPNEDPGFYGGEWIDPRWLDATLEERGGIPGDRTDALGGRSRRWSVGNVTVTVKNIARGRLRTDFCHGCPHEVRCGEGIYGLRVGVDGLWKPCLLRRSGFREVDRDTPYEEQILARINEMMGSWEKARFVNGAPV